MDTNFSSLTVPQLKALCKEKKITGYSKLGKAALLNSLIAHQQNESKEKPLAPTPRPSKPPAVSTLNTSGKVVDEAGDGLGQTLSIDIPCPTDEVIQSSKKLIATSTDLVSEGLRKSVEGNAFPGDGGSSSDSVIHQPLQVLGTNSTAKPLRTTSLTALGVKNSSNPSGITKRKAKEGSQSLIRKVPKLLHVTTVASEESTPGTLPNNVCSDTKRFKPLVSLVSERTVTLKLTTDVLTPTVSKLYYLDSPLPTALALQPLPFLGPEAERKEAQKWAILLSDLDDADRGSCILVSKMFQYAVYLSATELLSRDFAGRRLALVNQSYSGFSTNYFPYLRSRQLERNERIHAYTQSFLPKFFGDHIPICEALWTSSEHENQATIALRFLLTRLWFSLSVLGDRERASRIVVCDAHEILKGEIWSVRIRLTSADAIEAYSYETHYILEGTCEVIGQLAPDNQDKTGTSVNAKSWDAHLRVDWSEYVQYRLLPAGFHASPPPPISSQLRWTNGEEYDKGISRLWLKSMAKEGALGLYKRKVAERYVLACVVGNSVSGEWMSSRRMEAEFGGNEVSKSMPTRKKETPRVNLFLPAHHLVESVHFLARGGRALHRALAVVQTLSREYFILRDNGMEVGCEEDGVWDVWKNLLGCDGQGR